MNVASSMNDSGVDGVAYVYDALERPVFRNSDSFGYNDRSEVFNATVSGTYSAYGYDEIGNSSFFAANNLNQYSQFQYDLDGNMLFDGNLSFAYDSNNRLKTVSSNGVVLVINFYDAKSRRVKKVTPNATTIFIYDDWNLIEERVEKLDGMVSTIKYYWGKDLSGELQGAGGVGGLLYETIDDVIYIPCYDNNGSITKYVDANGNVVASYTYNAFGKLIAKSGTLADFFRHRFSTKYFDTETGFYYYGYRFYHPRLMRWLNRDPIEERGGLNLYGFCGNNTLNTIDPLGQDRYMTTFSIDPRKDQWHIGVAVDTWACQNGEWRKTGIVTFDYCVDDSKWWNRAGTFVAVAKGTIVENQGLTLVDPFTIPSSPQQDMAMIEKIREEMQTPPLYNFFFNNCIHWSTKAIDYGMDK